MSNDVNAFLKGQGAKAFTFESVGDTVNGEIVALDLRQQRDMQGVPKTFDDGSPQMVLVITMQTELHDDENDDGLRTFWVRGGNYTPNSGSGTSSLRAVNDAIRGAGAKDIETGGWLSATWSGIAKATQKGFSPPKLYTCEYKSPTHKVSLDDLG